VSDNTRIDYLDDTLNTLIGCSKVSPACNHCYAIRTTRRLSFISRHEVAELQCAAISHDTYWNEHGPYEWSGMVAVHPDAEKRIEAVRRKRRGRVIGVNFLADTFHEQVPDGHIDQLMALATVCPQHTFVFLTKRAQAMREYFLAAHTDEGWQRHLTAVNALHGHVATTNYNRPLPNVWLGVTAENQEQADKRIPILLQTPAAVRFVSMEPLLAPVDLMGLTYNPPGHGTGPWTLDVLTGRYGIPGQWHGQAKTLDWVIVGGESGPNARPIHPEWARSVRDQCAAAGVPFMFKQRGAWTWDDFDPYFKESNGTIDESGPWDHYICTNGEPGTCAVESDEEYRWSNYTGTPDDTAVLVRCVGKKAAGHLLDGVEHRDRPVAGGGWGS